MNFLYPSLLWGLLAMAIPIIVHFFNFRKLKKEVFSNLSFLKNVQTKTKSFLLLKHRLILLSRLLFIGALVLAFAQPFIPNKLQNNAANTGNVLGIYIDNSPSMQAEINGKATLDLAIKKIQKVADVLPRNTRIQLISNDFDADEHKIINAANLKNKISQINYSGITRTAPDIAIRLQSLTNKNTNRTGANQFIIFSDFQKSTLGNLSKMSFEKNEKVYLAPFKPEVSKNIYVDSVWLDNPFVRMGQKNRLNVKLKNSGDEEAKNINVVFTLNNTQLAAIPITIGSKASENTHFDINFTSNSIQKGKISVIDNPIIFDNNYYFVIKPSPRIRVVHIIGGASNGYLKNAFSNDSLFNYSQFSINNVDYGMLKNIDLLVIEAILGINENLKNSLIPFVNNGGTAVIIPAFNADYNSYNATLNSLGVQNISGRPISGTDFNILQEVNKNDVFYTDIFENTIIKDQLQMPKTQQIVSWLSTGQQLLKTKGGQNFMTYSKQNKGHVVMLASPIDPSFGNFAESPLFVPIFYKIAANSIGAEPMAFRYDNEYITIKAQNLTETSTIKLKANNVEFIPNYKLNGNDLTLELPNTAQTEKSVEAGYYDLLVNNKLITSLAINHSNVESQLDTYTTAELKRLFAQQKNVEILDEEDVVKFAGAFKATTQGANYWKYLIIAALIFLACEILLTRFWK